MREFRHLKHVIRVSEADYKLLLVATTRVAKTGAPWTCPWCQKYADDCTECPASADTGLDCVDWRGTFGRGDLPYWDPGDGALRLYKKYFARFAARLKRLKKV